MTPQNRIPQTQRPSRAFASRDWMIVRKIVAY
jgi:hypothetical protein